VETGTHVLLEVVVLVVEMLVKVVVVLVQELLVKEIAVVVEELLQHMIQVAAVVEKVELEEQQQVKLEEQVVQDLLRLLMEQVEFTQEVEAEEQITAEVPLMKDLEQVMVEQVQVVVL
jgi:hypothetical protein